MPKSDIFPVFLLTLFVPENSRPDVVVHRRRYRQTVKVLLCARLFKPAHGLAVLVFRVDGLPLLVHRQIRLRLY